LPGTTSLDLFRGKIFLVQSNHLSEQQVFHEQGFPKCGFHKHNLLIYVDGTNNAKIPTRETFFQYKAFLPKSIKLSYNLSLTDGPLQQVPTKATINQVK